MKKILACVDGSPRQDGVLAAAVALAGRTGAKIVLFRAVGLPRPDELPHDAYLLPPDEVKLRMEQKARAALEELSARVPAASAGGIRVATGAPWQAIERMAHEEDCDLIMIGAHGYDAIDRVLGTTAAKVVNHAHRAVLVVRAPDRLV
jgi:nucleotide-binding universal stress UspA family protein